MRLAFGDCLIDLAERRVFCAGHEIRLTPKSFELLRLLIENRPKALSKQEIFDRLWPGTFVTENNLATLVADLRSSLGDQAGEPRYIRTVYAYGYAFVAAVTGAPGAGASDSRGTRWILLVEQREVPLSDGENIIGRTGTGIIGLESSSVSRQHARLTVTNGAAMLEDLGSKNGTWIGPAQVTGPTPLKHGDEIRLGSLVVKVVSSGHLATTETVEQTSRPPFSG